MSQGLWSQSDLMRLSGHNKPEVRRWACERMKTLYGEKGTGILEGLLKDRDRDVLLEALIYLEEYPDLRFKEAVLKLYKRQTGGVSGRCAQLLGKMKDERLLEACAEKMESKSVYSDEVFWVIRGVGELATDQARAILRENLSEIADKADPIFVNALISALLNAREDLSVLLDCYERHYKDFAMEILHPFTSVCGSWYSLEAFKEEGKKKLFKKGLPRVVADSLSYMEGGGFLSLAKDLDREFKGGDYRQVMKMAWDQVEKWIDEKGSVTKEDMISKNDSPPEVNYRILKAFKEFSEKGPRESFKAMAIATLIILARFVEFRNLVGLKIEEMDEKDLFEVLFDKRGTLEIDDRLMEKIWRTVEPGAIFDHCLRQLKDFPSSLGTERALKLLGRLKDPRAIPDLVGFFGGNAGDLALDECIRTLAQMGTHLVAYLENTPGQLNQKQWAEILYALKDIPEERAADLLIRRWDKLWTDHKETFVYALEGIASQKFIEPLRKELREGEALEEEAFYLLCHIHGVDDPVLPQIEKQMAQRRKETEKRLKAFDGGDAKGLLDRTTLIELRCRQCGKIYHYEVEDVYITRSRKEAPKILDTIVCKNCRAVNQYEITPQGHLAITAQLLLMTLVAEKGKLDPKTSPLKIVETGLMDGRRMSFDESLKHYEREIKKSPTAPDLRVGYGNLLLKSGRGDEAAMEFKEAIRLDPLAVEAYYSLGDREADAGNPSKAYEYLRKAADQIHTGHYYKTKEIDQLKEAIFTSLEEIEETLGIVKQPVSSPPVSFISSQKAIPRGKVGRNDPCPCGSGKKYKKCCLNKDEQRKQEKTSLTSEESQLRERLLSFSSKERYKKDLERAYRLFCRKRLKESLVMDEAGEINFGFFLEWFNHDYRLKNGLTIIEEYYQEKKAKLSKEEDSLLKYEMASYLSLYEVISITPEEGLRLKDLVTGEEMEVFEVKGTRFLTKWDVIFARVIRMGSVNKLSGLGKIIPRHEKEEILSSIQTSWENVNKETGKMEWHDFMKSNAHLVHRLIEDRKPIEPVFITEEHHRLLSSKAVFDVVDFDTVKDRLGREFDFVPVEEEKRDEIRLAWLKRGRSKVWDMGEDVENGVILMSQMIGEKGELKWSSLGDVVLTPRRLELSCLSRERLDRGKVRLQELLGGNVKHRVDHYEDIAKKIKGEGLEEPSFRKEEMPEEHFRIYSKVAGEWVMKWVDEKIPALGGRTPREAVQTSEGREKVEEILRDWENMEERKRKDGEPYININVIREMLNL